MGKQKGKTAKKTESKKNSSSSSSDFKLIKSIMRKTLGEMANDLTSVAPVEANNLLRILSMKTDTELLTELQNVESELYKSIPTDILSKDVAGLKYLRALAIVQPLFNKIKEHKMKEDKKSDDKVKNQQENIKNTETLNKLSDEEMLKAHEKLVDMVGKDEDGKEMLNLTKDIMKELKLEDRAMDKMDMKDMIEIMGKAKNYVENKVKTGELDFNKLQKQTMSMLSNMQNTNEFKQMNEMAQGILSNTGNKEGLPDMSNLSSMMGMMNSLGPLGEMFGAAGGEKTVEQKQAEEEADKMLAELGGLD